tara:strand:- start:1960 stop:2919 length:960 start_codon:yes stop_codon:yes gene_type:complete
LKNKISIIVGGSGQFGIELSKSLLKRKHVVIITSRDIKRAKQKLGNNRQSIIFIKLNILNVKQIEKLLIKYNPDNVFYFASQSSPGISFKKPRATYLSNFVGCKNFLEIIKFKNLTCKFINASSCEIFSKSNKRLTIASKKKPISPYGKSKLLSYNITKSYRNNYNINSYNAVIFNTESIYREKNYLIPKICISAIRAYKYQEKTDFGNLKISREWNWCEEQIKFMLKFINKTPQDFILSNQKNFTAIQMLRFAFGFFKLNYKNFILINKRNLRPNDFLTKKSNSNSSFKKNKIKHNYKIYGKKIIYKIIKHYLNEKKY